MEASKALIPRIEIEEILGFYEKIRQYQYHGRLPHKERRILGMVGVALEVWMDSLANSEEYSNGSQGRKLVEEPGNPPRGLEGLSVPASTEADGTKREGVKGV